MSDDDNNNETSSCFWLPSEFFTDDDFLPEKLTPNKNTTITTDSTNCCWAMSTSPQSTLAHYRSWAGSSNGSPQGVHSPPSTPFLHQNDAVRDLIDKAANQVATLNLTHNFGHGPTKNNNFLGPHNSQFQRSERVMGKMGQGGWTVQQGPTRFLAGSGSVKRKCAGTGVFLPRAIRNETSNGSYISDSRNKPGFGLVPDRNVNHVFSQSQPVSQPQFNLSHNQNYDSLMARRNFIIAQRRALLIAQRSLMMSRDMYLPQEWTY